MKYLVENSLAENSLSCRSETAGKALEHFDSIVRHNQRRIFRIIYLYLHDADAADTLTQECFLRAYANRARFRGECSVETWLVRIAVNLAHDYAKNRRRGFWLRLVRSEKALAGKVADPHLSPEGVVLAGEEVAALWAGVESLSPRQRAVFVLHFAEEMELQEIASALQMNLGTVKSHLSRALVTLRLRLRGGSRVRCG